MANSGLGGKEYDKDTPDDIGDNPRFSGCMQHGKNRRAILCKGTIFACQNETTSAGRGSGPF
jgi:hypothetical protein